MKQKLFMLLFFSPIFTNGQIITTFAGSYPGLYIDGGSAIDARLILPHNGKFDKYGNYYFGQGSANPAIRMINTSNSIYTIAGTGPRGYSGDGGPATAALIDPQGFTADENGNVYICEYYNGRIRKVDATTHIITTIAGTGVASFSGDGGAATAAAVMPIDATTDNKGNIYFTDGGINASGTRVRVINSAGIISTIAGNGTYTGGGDGGSATDASIGCSSICLDPSGNLYLGSFIKIRKIDMKTGIISSFAGAGSGGYGGDGGPATAAQFTVHNIEAGRSGNLYIADMTHNRVCEIDASGTFHLIAGTGACGISGDGGSAKAAELCQPAGLALDSCGNLYIADNDRIRKVAFNPGCWKTSVQSITALSAVKIYPNPAYDIVTIKAGDKMERIAILNMVGQVVHSASYNSSEAEIDISGLPTGMYLVRINDSEVRKFVKQ